MSKTNIFFKLGAIFLIYEKQIMVLIYEKRIVVFELNKKMIIKIVFDTINTNEKQFP